MLLVEDVVPEDDVVDDVDDVVVPVNDVVVPDDELVELVEITLGVNEALWELLMLKEHVSKRGPRNYDDVSQYLVVDWVLVVGTIGWDELDLVDVSDTPTDI